MSKRTAVTVCSLIVAGILLGAGDCDDKYTEPWNDAPRSNVTNEAPADIVTFPDGFSNVATKCDHGNRIYSGYKGDQIRMSIAVVPNDPTCAGK